MGYNVVLKNGVKDVLNFWVPAFLAAQNAVIDHLSKDHRHRATITDANNGDLRHYHWIGDKLNIAVF